jgi:hypothetical protein
VGHLDVGVVSIVVIAAALVCVGTYGTLRLLSRIDTLNSRVKNLEDELARVRGELRRFEDRVSTLEDFKIESVRGLDKRGDRPKEDKYLDLKILKLYSEGKSIREIASEVGMSKSSVHRRLKKLLSK